MSDVQPQPQIDPLTLQLLSQLMYAAPNIAGPGYDKYGNPEEMTTGEQAKQGNFLQDITQMINDPTIGLLGSAFGINGGVDYMQLAEDPMAGAPQFVAPPTPTYSAYQAQAEQDPQVATILAAIEGGKTRAQIAAMFEGTDLTPEAREAWMADVDAIYKERNDLDLATREHEAEVAGYKPELSPLDQLLRDAGLPSALEQYSKYDYQPELAGYEQQAEKSGRRVKQKKGNLDRMQNELAAALKKRTLDQQYGDLGFSPEQAAQAQQGWSGQGAGQIGNNGMLQTQTYSAGGGGQDAALPHRPGQSQAPIWAGGPGSKQMDISELEKRVQGADTGYKRAQVNDNRSQMLQRMMNNRAEAVHGVQQRRGDTPLNNALVARLASMRAMGLGI